MLPRQRFVTAILILVGGCLALWGWRNPANAQTDQTAKPVVKIGVYDSRAVIVGARDSKGFNTGVADLMRQKDEAETAGDTRRVQQLKHKGNCLQQLRHAQAFSTAPVDDVLEQIKDKLPAIAEKAGVDVIVARPDYVAKGVEIVDVTDQIVAELSPSEKTLKTVAEMRKHKPISLLEALMIDD